MKKDKQKGNFRKFCMVMSRMLLALFLIVFIATTFLFIKYYGKVMALYNDSIKKVESINAGTFKSKMPTVIYDKDGQVLAELAPRKYEYIESKDIQKNIKNAFISIEDNRFLEHNGVDFKGLTRAGVELLRNKGKITQGGSTITQQLVKNVLLTQEQSYTRKIKEMFISFQIEKKYTKEQILEFYINNIYFGNGAYGIETASNIYFSKPSKDLTLAETSFLCAIPNNPNMYNPIKNKAKTMERSKRILGKMRELNFINEQDYQTAIKQEIQLKIQEEKPVPETYLVSYALNCATKELMIKNDFKFKNKFSSDAERTEYWNNEVEAYKEAYAKVRNGGYKIYTSLDSNKQKILQDQMNSNLSDLSNEKNRDNNLYKIQGAGVCIDNETGNVVAIVGGRTQDDVNNSFNRGYLAVRQPGSAIKPIVAYAPAYELGMLPSSTIDDSSIDQGPKNHTGGYSGNVTLRYATETSINTIPFKIATKYEPSNLLEYLYNMNFKYLTQEDNNPIISVGGFTKGVTPEEMAGAYSTLARNGEYIKASCIEKIEDYANEVVYKNKHTKVRVYDKGGAYLTTDTLKGVIEQPYATGHKMKLDNGIISAGKTGTTDDCKDAWFAGYTPYYTTVVWVGADKPTAIDSLYGGTYPGSIWKGFMNEIHKGYESKDFTKPDEVFEAYVSGNYKDYSLEDNGWDKITVTKKFTQLIDERKRKEEEERRRLAEEREKQRQIEEQQRLEREKKEIEERENNLRTNILPQVKQIHVSSETDLPKANKTIKELKNIGKLNDASIIQEVLNEISRLQQEKAPFDQIIEQREEAERQRIETERQKQLDEQKRIQLEQERKQLEEDKKKLEEEKKKLEEEKKKQQEQQNNNPSNNNPSNPSNQPSNNSGSQPGDNKDSNQPSKPSNPIKMPEQPNN